MKDCCADCFGDKFIREYIKQANRRGRCRYCRANNRQIRSVAEVGAFIRQGLERAYCHPVHELGPYDHEDERYMWGDPEDCDTLLDVLSQEAFSGRSSLVGDEEHLALDLMSDSGPSWHDVADGATDEFGGLHDPIAIQGGFFGRQDTGVDSAWDAFKHRVSYMARFFDAPSLGASRQELLKPIIRFVSQCHTTLKAETAFWRARPVDDREVVAREKEALRDAVGAAPSRKAKGNRMSPPGISYMYLSNLPETCIAEVDASSGRAWLGEFVLLSSLRVLDLTGRHAPPMRSIFDPDYDHGDRWARDIVADFAEEIARPVLQRDEAIEFVPTQVLAECLRVAGWQGLLYRSEKDKKGVNLVVFFGPKMKELVDVPPQEVGMTPFFGDIMCIRQFREVRDGKTVIEVDCGTL